MYPFQDDFSDFPDQADDLSDFPDQHDRDRERERPKAWYDEILTGPNAVRFGLSALGDLASFTGVGPFIGAAAGEGIGRWMEGKEFDPAIMALEGGLNYLPGAGKLERTGLKELGKYAGRSAMHGAVQGAVGAFPRHQADIGTLLYPKEWEMPSAGEIAGQTIGGGVIGGVVGGTLGGLQSHGLKSVADTHVPPPSKIEAPPLDIPTAPRQIPFDYGPQLPRLPGMDPFERPTEFEGPEIGPYGTGEGQPRLPLEDEFGQQRLDIDLHRPQEPEYHRYGPLEEPTPQDIIKDLPEGARAEDLKLLLQQGWEQYGINPETHRAQLILRAGRQVEVPPTPQVAPPTIPTPTPTPTPQVDMGEGIPFNSDEGFVIPSDKLTPEIIEDLTGRGFSIDKVPGGALFKRLVEEEEGTFDPQQMWQNLKRLLGRDPTPEEVERGMARQPVEGEQTGRVADFEPKDTRESLSTESLLQYADYFRRSGENPRLLRGIENLLRTRGINPETAEVPPLNTSVYNGWNWNEPGPNEMGTPPSGRGPEEMARDVFGPPQTPQLGQPFPRLVVPEEGGLDVGGIRQQNVLGPPALIEEPPIDFTSEMTGIPPIDPKKKYQQPWEHRPGDPLEIMEKREELESLMNPAGKEFPEWTQAQIDRMVQLNDELDEFDDLMGMKPSNLGPSYRSPEVPNKSTLFSEMSGVSPDDFIRMEIGDREDILRNMIGQYAEHGGRVANKELLQNAIDALTNPDGTGKPGGKVEVSLNYNGKPSITVSDNGPGLPIDLIKNEFVTLTGSGKRGKGKFVGEMGVGKATYLLGTDSFSVTTITREPDGTLWKYEFSGTPEDMITGRIQVNREQQMVDQPTGTKVTVYDKDKKNIEAAESFLEAFAKYSSSPIEVSMRGNRYGPDDFKVDVQPRTPGPSKLVSTGTAPGGDYAINVPDNAEWQDEASSIAVIISNRGMFQGVDTIYLSGRGRLPDRVVMEVQPNVTATDKSYPLTAPTRERMKAPFKEEIRKSIEKDIMQAAKKKREQEIQQVYNNMVPAPGQRFVIHDSGNRYTPEELANVNNSRHMQSIANTMEAALVHLDGLHPTEQIGKTAKFGFLIGDPDKIGINIVDPSSPYSARKFAVTINPFAIMQVAKTPKEAAQLMLHAITHEFTHNIKRQEGAGFTWALAQAFGKFGLEEQVAYKNAILNAITEPNGGYAPEIQKLLSEYSAARGRPDTQLDLLSAARDSEFLEAGGQGRTTGGDGHDGEGILTSEMTSAQIPKGKEKPKESLGQELYNFSRGALTPLDLSASMRQGFPLITTKEWWTSWSQQISALGSEKGYQKTLADLKARPMFQDRVDYSGSKVKITPSFAKRAGIKIMDIDSAITSREEATASRWINKIPGARASNRAYTAYLNQLRADSFESLIKDAHTDFKAGTKGAKNPYTDLTFAKEIADYVNTATGRGPLRITGITGKEHSFEQAAGLLTNTIFSPRLFFARVRMLNPATYAMASPFVRKQYIKSLLSTAGAWGTISGLAAIAGADVSTDPNSADFGKIKIPGTNTRIDPAGGFQQYLVAASRLISGKTTSSASGQEFELGAGYRADTRADVVQRFATNKLHPVLKFAWDIANASERIPFHVTDRILQLFVPLIVQDTIELAKEDPKLLPLLGPVGLGMGTQTYGQGESVGKFIPPESDVLFEGGILPNPFASRRQFY